MKQKFEALIEQFDSKFKQTIEENKISIEAVNHKIKVDDIREPSIEEQVDISTRKIFINLRDKRCFENQDKRSTKDDLLKTNKYIEGLNIMNYKQMELA